MNIFNIPELPENLTPEEKARLRELYLRRNLCNLFRMIVNESDDPRRDDVMAEYNRQLASIDAKIAAIVGKPPDVVVGLKPAVLFPKSEGAGR